MDSSAPEAGADGAAFIGQLERARQQFLALVEPVRPELHRYCARMTGAIADGEDVVQETLAAAYYELSQMKMLPPLRPWLFRIAHNRAIDHWRREQVRRSEPLDAAADVADDAAQQPDHLLARSQTVRMAISSFLQLAPAQRACVILKDVLDHSLDDIASELEMSLPAVKAALHRGRAALPALGGTVHTTPLAREVSPALQRYASLFNARDWDGVRALLADDVKLDLVSRRKMAGRHEVGSYFSNYASAGDWRLTPAWFDGSEVLAVQRHAGDPWPGYLIALDWYDGRVRTIRDYRYVPYIAQEGAFELAG
jgi:RNA polymerase sigma factor (sigma-70 family)